MNKIRNIVLSLSVFILSLSTASPASAVIGGGGGSTPPPPPSPGVPQVAQGAVLYTRDAGNSSQIFVLNAGSSTPVQLTTQGNNSGGVWSHDGARIAFRSDRNDQSGQVFVMNRDGSGQTNILDTPTSGPVFGGSPAWTADDSHIIFSCVVAEQMDHVGALGPQLCRVSANGGPITTLNNDTTVSRSSADLSPMTGKIAFVVQASAGANDAGLYVGDVSDIEHATQITDFDNSVNDGHPRWSPDGSKIAFSRQENGTTKTYTVSPSGGDLQLLSDGYGLSWAGDGNQYVYSSSANGSVDLFAHGTDGLEYNLTNSSTTQEGYAEIAPGAFSVLPPVAPPQNTLVTSVSSSISSTTPLWNLDITVGLQGAVCPSQLSLKLGSLTKRFPICRSGDSAPSQIKVTWKVFDNKGNLLTPGSSVAPTAKVVGSKASGYDGSAAPISVPTAPVWIGLGDSFSSGHHQDADDITCIPLTGCTPASLIPNDPSYSWVTQVGAKLNSQLKVPEAWKVRSTVLAQSGASTGQVVGSQLPAAVQRLQANPNSWNMVSVTGGADDIQFRDALESFYLDNVDSIRKPWNLSNRQDCPDTELLYQRTLTNFGAIISNLQTIVAQVKGASEVARVVNLNYPYVVATNNVCFSDTGDGVHGVGSLIDKIADAHMAINGPGVVSVNLREAFGATPMSRIQKTRYYGYPHPNESGQLLIAKSAYRALVQSPVVVGGGGSF